MNIFKAVAFDWGGVLADSSICQMVDFCAKKIGVSPAVLAPAIKNHEPAFMVGNISEEELWETISMELGLKKRINCSLYSEALVETYKPREEMFNLVSRIKNNGYKTALLSDAEAPVAEFYFKKDYPMFDATVFSSYVGVEKPDRRIYEILLDRLNTKPEETVFFDDLDENIDGAKSIGIYAIRYEDPQQVKNELSRLGININ